MNGISSQGLTRQGSGCQRSRTVSGKPSLFLKYFLSFIGVFNFCRTYYDGSQFLSRLGLPFAVPGWFLDSKHLPTFFFIITLTLSDSFPLYVQSYQRMLCSMANSAAGTENLNSWCWPSKVSIWHVGRTSHSRSVPHSYLISFHFAFSTPEKTLTACLLFSHHTHQLCPTTQIFDIPSIGAQPFEECYATLQERFGVGGTQALDHIAVVEHKLVKDCAHVLMCLEEVESQGGEGIMLRRAGS